MSSDLRQQGQSLVFTRLDGLRDVENEPLD